MHYYHNSWMTWAWQNLIAMVKENYESEENVNDALVFGAYITTPVSRLRDQITSERGSINKLIAYQSEPLVSSHNIPRDKIISSLREFDEVWEFDYENVILLLKEGINVKYRPPVHTKSLRLIENLENPEIDVLFYGSFSDRRANLIRNFHDGYVYSTEETSRIFQNFNLIWAWNLSYEKLQKYIANSKIILNLHPYDGESRQQTVRMFYPLINDKVIVSEKSSVNYFGDSIHEFSNVQQLGDIIVNQLKDDNWRNKTLNYNKHFLNLGNRSNFAIFYDVDDSGEWEKEYQSQIAKLQNLGIYDKADYIHINHKKELPLYFYRVNRHTVNEDIDSHIDMFKNINSQYKIIKITNNQISGL